MLLLPALQVKENFERFISCKSTIDDIHGRLRKAEGEYGDSVDGASTADMAAAVTDVSLPACWPSMHVLPWTQHTCMPEAECNTVVSAC